MYNTFIFTCNVKFFKTCAIITVITTMKLWTLLCWQVHYVSQDIVKKLSVYTHNYHQINVMKYSVVEVKWWMRVRKSLNDAILKYFCQTKDHSRCCISRWICFCTLSTSYIANSEAQNYILIFLLILEVLYSMTLYNLAIATHFLYIHYTDQLLSECISNDNIIHSEWLFSCLNIEQFFFVNV